MLCNDTTPCDGMDIYCPETADCALECDGDDGSECYGVSLYSNPIDEYEDSLMNISCQSGQCIIFIHDCSDSEYSECEVNAWNLLGTISCSSTVPDCHVRTLTD